MMKKFLLGLAVMLMASFTYDTLIESEHRWIAFFYLFFAFYVYHYFTEERN
jgi:hypothetical protein